MFGMKEKLLRQAAVRMTLANEALNESTALILKLATLNEHLRKCNAGLIALLKSKLPNLALPNQDMLENTDHKSN
jgi:hypothetical protein